MVTLIVVPTFNERENLPVLLDRLGDLGLDIHVLVVDDNSPDGTGKVADELASRLTWVHVLHRPHKLGLGTAYVDGFRFGLERDYPVIGGMDADLSHDPSYLPAMLKALEGADLVVGSRYVPGGAVRNWGTVRRLISSGGNYYSRAILRIDVKDLTTGFRLFRRQLLENLDLDRVHSSGYSFLIETTYRALKRAYRVAEVPIVFEERKVGRSKLSCGVVLEAMIVVPRLRLIA